VDFGVLEKFRRKGIGTRLMDVAEQIASEKADTVTLAVGLHSGYGSAQRMYVKRGYIPDGSGVWYDTSPAVPYQNYCNDDSLLLYFSKKLR
jgi:GNAT superfamily N-acetyltransferase